MPKLLIPVALLSSALFNRTAWAEDIRRLNHTEATKQALVKPQPAYPMMARQLRLPGRVEVEASIAEDGTVGEIQPCHARI